MAYVKCDEASLTAVADAIREKGGTTEQMVFPDGFVEAIDGIQAGGGAAKDATIQINNDAPVSISYYCFCKDNWMGSSNATSVAKDSSASLTCPVGEVVFIKCSRGASTSSSTNLNINVAVVGGEYRVTTTTYTANSSRYCISLVVVRITEETATITISKQ